MNEPTPPTFAPVAAGAATLLAAPSHWPAVPAAPATTRAAPRCAAGHPAWQVPAAGGRPRRRPEALVAAVQRPAAGPADRAGAGPPARPGSAPLAHRAGARRPRGAGAALLPHAGRQASASRGRSASGSATPQLPAPACRPAGRSTCSAPIAAGRDAAQARLDGAQARWHGRTWPWRPRPASQLRRAARLRSAAAQTPVRRRFARRDRAPDRLSANAGFTAPAERRTGARQRGAGPPAHAAARGLRPGW
jgi:multidrug efflux system outer membrane protein